MRGKDVKSKLAMLLLGDVGTHKSEIALQSTMLKRPDGKPMRVLYIDCENGSIVDRLGRFEKAGVNLDNLEIRYTQSYNKVIELVDRVANKEDWYEEDDNGEETDTVRLDSDGKPFRPDFIVVDGMKILFDSRQATYLSSSSKRAKLRAIQKEMDKLNKEVTIEGAKLEPSDYQRLNFDGSKLIIALVGSGANFVVTCFAKPEMENDPTTTEKDSFGNPKKRPTGKIINEGFKGMIEYCKTIMVLSTDEFGEVKGRIQDKDRTEIFASGTVIENPNLLMWQKAISKDTLVIHNKVDESVSDDSNKMILNENPNAKARLEQIDKEDAPVKEPEPKEEPKETVASLVATIDRLMGASGSDQRKSNVSKLKTAGKGNYKKLTDMNALKEYIKILSA